MKKLIYIILITGIIFGFPSCETADSIYKEYLVPNGLTYPAKAMNPVAYPGKERIQILWQNGTDPSVVKARISWNNDTEWVDVDIQPGADTISRIIESLPENTYSFMIRTYDAKGNVSIPVEMVGTVYGEKYINTLTNRVLLSTYYDGLDLKLNWYVADEDETCVSVNYTDIRGTNHNVVVDPSETETLIPEFDADRPLFYSTMYKPDSLAIDVFHAEAVERMINTVVNIAKDTWAEYTLPGDAPTYNDNYTVRKLWDNDFSEGLYHTDLVSLPSLATWDLGVKVKLNRMKLYPRFHPVDTWGRAQPKVFEVYGSLAPNPDGSLDNSWTLLGHFECVKPSPGEEVTQADIDFARAGIDFEFVQSGSANPSATVRYIRFRTIKNFDNESEPVTYVTIQEISFWGRLVR